MSQEAWPTPADDGAPRPSREPLPRVEDLPVAEQGYDQQSVKAAFDSFYRHAAQLDASLRTLEAVDSFHRQAAALRADLRTLRTAGWTQQSWPTTPAYGYSARSPREGISPAVWRIAGEAAFLIAVAVALGVAQVAWWVIVLVMALAWLIVGLIEWSASRDLTGVRVAPPVPVHPVVDAEPAEGTEEPDSLGWTAFEEAQEPSDAMTMIGAPPAVVEGEPEQAEPAAEAEPLEEPAGDAPAEHEAALEEPAPEEPRRRWWARKPDDGEPAPAIANSDPPRNVRVLPTDDDVAPSADSADVDDIDPWERGFDDAVLVADAPEVEPDEETGEDQAALVGEPEPPSRKRFRRR